MFQYSPILGRSSIWDLNYTFSQILFKQSFINCMRICYLSILVKYSCNLFKIYLYKRLWSDKDNFCPLPPPHHFWSNIKISDFHLKHDRYSFHNALSFPHFCLHESAGHLLREMRLYPWYPHCCPPPPRFWHTYNLHGILLKLPWF